MAASNARHRHFARRALLHSAGSATPTHARVTDAFLASRESLRAALLPLFGATAVDTLFERSRHLASNEFAWLPTLLSKNPRAKIALAPDLTLALNADDLLTGLAAVLAHDIGLLVGLVGGDLILPLVHKAWGIDSSSSTDESD